MEDRSDWTVHWSNELCDDVRSYLTAREQKLCRRRAKVEKLLAWKQKLDDEEKEIERLEKEAVEGVALRRASSVNDSIMSGEDDAARITFCYCYCMQKCVFAIDRACIDHYARTVSEWSKDNTVSFSLRDMITRFRDCLGR